ncbi:hypothetical protein EON68_04390, partial [archaeon]
MDALEAELLRVVGACAPARQVSNDAHRGAPLAPAVQLTYEYVRMACEHVLSTGDGAVAARFSRIALECALQ